jgi:hypothetical protein
MIRHLAILAGCVAVLLAFASPAVADLINPRPVAVGPSLLPSETSLQEFFDNQTGSTINVATDQTGFAIFAPTSNNVSTVTLRLEETLLESRFGIYKLGDPDKRLTVFFGTADPGDPGHFSNLVFNADGVSGKVVVNRFDSSGTFLSTGTRFDFGDEFGFYLERGIGDNLVRFFSEDSLNENQNAHFLAYMGNGTDGGVFFIAAEDSRNFLLDHDYNDFVVGTESMNPVAVPEPAALFLLGSGLLGLIGRRWRNGHDN